MAKIKRLERITADEVLNQYRERFGDEADEEILGPNQVVDWNVKICEEGVRVGGVIYFITQESVMGVTFYIPRRLWTEDGMQKVTQLGPPQGSEAEARRRIALELLDIFRSRGVLRNDC